MLVVKVKDTAGAKFKDYEPIQRSTQLTVNLDPQQIEQQFPSKGDKSIIDTN